KAISRASTRGLPCDGRPHPAAARSIGNHRVAPHLAARLSSAKAVAAGWGLPSQGSPRVLALLIAFSDYPGWTDPAAVDAKLFGDGDPMAHPYESLRNFYRRASYDLLEIGGSTLGWYTAPYPRSAVEQTTAGREAVIREAIMSFDAAGHDFSQYDNDGDGAIDYFIVVWTGPHDDWAEFWWGYQTRFQDGSFRVDGTRLAVYSWQWENYDWPGPFDPTVVIHETGHALGLPDYYDYDDSIGPRGGVGGLDQMDSNWGDHNCFSKYLLGWLTPEAVNQGTAAFLLSPSGDAPEAALLMNGDLQTDPYGEHFMVQLRRRQANDSDYPADGLLVWHVDARTGPDDRFLYDNSYTDHKLLRLMEADGLEEIEQNGSADAGDFFTPGDVFGPDTHPGSSRYDGASINLLVDAIADSGQDMAFQASLGSGCALFCDAAVVATAWPRSVVSFDGSVSTENCVGSPSSGWTVGSAVLPGAASIDWALPAGSYQWSFAAELGDAACTREGELLVCADERCWQWAATQPMAVPRALHAAVRLRDGRVLVAGGGQPQIYDPAGGGWTPTGVLEGGFGMARAVVLDDGRVLLTGSTPADPVNAAIYDPGTDSWRATAPMQFDRTYHSAARLGDGRVLVAGGFFDDGQGATDDVLTTEVFDPTTESWSVVGDLPEAIELPGLTPLADGRALLTGNRRALYFDPATDSWTAGRTLAFPRRYHAAVPLPSGRVLLIGGAETLRVTDIDPVANRESSVTVLSSWRILPAAAVLPSGNVLVSGGIDSAYRALATADLIDPVEEGWSEVAAMADARFGHELTLLAGGDVLVTGGATVTDGGGELPLASAERYARPAVGPLRSTGRVAP
ncbi:MAG TPA: M6 family metalloprotease domain-containing protein, partial [Thermoanaerobaculales bacterium]|nr:M6 family metalloprotease domain-containing protein [Thermoanaerobaculales bacterium]